MPRKGRGASTATGRLQRRVRYPCIACDKACGVDTIECTQCQNWVHRECVPMSKETMRQFANDDISFRCRRCACDGDAFHYESCLERLRASQTTAAANSELMLLNVYVGNIICNDSSELQRDVTAECIIRVYQPTVLQQYLPYAVSGDGNCCYRAVSLGLYGTQAHHLHVRSLTAIEMLLHRQHYDTSSPQYVGGVDAGKVYVDPYDSLMASVMTPGGYAELTHLYAISAATGHVIQSYMPPSAGLLQNPYSTHVVGRDVRPTASPSVILMWSMSSFDATSEFRPNHFALLKPAPPDAIAVELDNNEQTADHSVAQQTDHSVTTVDFDVSMPTPEQDAKVDTGSTPESPCTTSGTAETCSSIAFRVQALPTDDWLSTDEIMQLLSTPSGDVICKRVPSGKKENVYCIVDMSANVQRVARGQRRAFDDDCGAWSAQGSRLNSFPYLRNSDGSLRRLFKSGGKYCEERKVDRKRVYVPIDPQPAPSDITTLVRYYATSATNNDYRKRVTWLADTPPSTPPVAVVEYRGKQPEPSCHGNAVHKEAAYVRVPAATMDKLAEEVQKAPPRQVYNQLLLDLDDDFTQAPRDYQAVRDKKKYEKKKGKTDANTTPMNNFADEILHVLSMAQTDDFVQQVTVAADRIPSVVLFSSRQIRDIKAFCFERTCGSVLAVDKTYNLGCMFVTVSTYTNLAVDRVRTGKSPTFIGPIFLHGKSTAETYHIFFNSIASRLQESNFNELRVGSDDEYALRKALQFCFPGSVHVACRRHLKTNALHYAQDVVGMSRTARNQFVTSIFGDDGLASCTDVASFDTTLDKLQSGLLSKLPDKMQQYFNNRLLHFLRDNVAAHCADWMNNGCESINHVLKSVTQWRPQKIPELIKKLRLLVEGQYVEADRAMLGQGDLALKAAYAKHRLTVDQWRTMTTKQRDRARDQCFRLSSLSGTVTSSDETLVVRPAPHGGRKPHQRKRPTADRTTTPSRPAKSQRIDSDVEDEDFA